MSISTKIFLTKTLDPWWNLAIEEYLLETVEKDKCILYLWQNENTVVIGKNQNPWRECRTELLEREGGKLARRLSGGGTVFHDLGNLNFTFITNRENYNLEKQMKVILSAVSKVGIHAELNGRNDITLEGRKFSGNAFCFRKKNAYHHGTILVSTDIDKLTKYLQVSDEKIKSKGVRSVQSRVVNLTEHQPLLTIEKMENAFVEAFNEYYGGNSPVSEDTKNIDQVQIEELYKKYSSWNWRYGEVLEFDVKLTGDFSWGGLEIGFQLKKGRVDKATVYSDALDEEFIGMLPKIFEGNDFSSANLANSIYMLDVNKERKQFAKDIFDWLSIQEF
jgi:lipoate-protein ligase A